MSHPAPHPGTPTPPPGPSRLLMNLRAIAQEIAARHAAAKGRAQVAGARSHSAEPMGHRRRHRNYWLQNGSDRALTPKQRRRWQQKFNRLVQAD